MDEPNSDDFRPPYLPFKTFWSFIEELAGKPLPPNLDRSLLRSKSGTDQAALLAAFRAFGFISGEDNEVQTALKEMIAADEEARKQRLATMLRLRYSRQFELSDQNATEPRLNSSFEEDFGINGETRRKAVTFFLQAARFAGLSLSAHFPTTRLGSGRRASTAARPGATKKVAAKRAAPKPPPDSSGGLGAGEKIEVQIGSSGTVTMVVNVRWLELEDETFTQLRQLTRDLKALGTTPAAPGVDEWAGEPEAEDDEEEPF